MSKPCRKCQMEIPVNELPIICEGFCQVIQRYHAKCVGLTAVDRDACCLRNVLWMCDECCELMTNIKFRSSVNGWKAAEHDKECEIEYLRNEVKQLDKTINGIINTQDNSRANSISPFLSTTSPCDDTIGTKSEKLSSTRLFGTYPRINHENTSNATNVSDSHQTSGKLRLHLSNIAVDVTGNEVTEMVHKALGVSETPTVKRLVPSWMDT